MPASRMHDGELEVDAALVRRLLAGQLPRWAGLPIVSVPSAGTDNALFRLGDDMVVRLPRISWAVGQAEKEHVWLPRLAPFLPLEVPAPLALSEPAEGYPWRWAVYRWIDGDDATVAPVADLRQASSDLARFVVALHGVDPSGGPPPGPDNSSRGEALANRDARTRAAIAELRSEIDARAVTAVWESALAAPAWEGAPVWIHGDLSPLNLIVERGRLRAVIDWGCLGVGDPACDAMVAWDFLTEETRPGFRAALAIDDATWARARGWALSVALEALPYYQTTNPILAARARHRIRETVADYGCQGSATSSPFRRADSCAAT